MSSESLRICRLASVPVIAVVLALTAAPLLHGASKRDVVLRAAVMADSSGPDRAQNLVRAVERLNKALPDVTIQLQLEEPPSPSWADETQRLMRAFAADDAPDIYAIAHEFIGQFAKAGYALALDDLIRQYPDTYNDFFPSIWQSVKVRGRVYAIPQDTDDRMLYFRVDRLKQFGWSDAQIKSLPDRIQRAEFTLTDMAELAKRVKDKNLVEWGFYHRPTRGPDYYQLILAYGGRLQDEPSGKLVLTRSATLEFLKLLHELVYGYKVTPASMTNTPWRSVHGGFGGEGKVLFWLGGSWNGAGYIQDYGVPANDFFNRMDWGLVPAGRKGGKALTMSHPIIYVVSARSKDKDLAFRVVTEASSADLNAMHALHSFNLPVRKAVTQIPTFKSNVWLSRATELLPFTTFIPNHEDWGKYDQTIYEAMQAVETNRLTPDKALAFVEMQMKTQIPDLLVEE
jgi:inositol-phosphate transport system substrate-binding protein